MITTAQMYWIMTLNGIVIWSTIIAVVFIFLTVMFTCVTMSCDGDHWGIPVFTGILALVFMAISMFVQSTKQMAAILIIPRIANSEKVQQAGNKLYDLAVKWMDDLKPNKNNKKGTGK